MGTVHEDHPTLYRACDLQRGWKLLNYLDDSAIQTVKRVKKTVLVKFASGREDSWNENDQVHAEPPS